MGQPFSRFFARWQSRNERRVLLVGLDAAGKTSSLSPPLPSPFLPPVKSTLVVLFAHMAFSHKSCYIALILMHAFLCVVAVLYQMKAKGKSEEMTMPTVGFNVELLKLHEFKVSIWVSPCPCHCPCPCRLIFTSNLIAWMTRMLEGKTNCGHIGGTILRAPRLKCVLF